MTQRSTIKIMNAAINKLFEVFSTEKGVELMNNAVKKLIKSTPKINIRSVILLSTLSYKSTTIYHVKCMCLCKLLFICSIFLCENAKNATKIAAEEPIAKK